MSATLKCLFLAAIPLVAIAASNGATTAKPPSCKEFSRDVTFNDNQAVGTWHLLHFKTEKSKGSPRDSHCVKFTAIEGQERKDLSNRIGKFVNNLKWENLTLKMQIPCADTQAEKARDYYLEKIVGDDGSYQTLQMPAPTAKLETANFHRYPMRLKIIEGLYLGMMDCHEKFVFLLGKQLPKGELDQRLRTMIETYWPDEH